MLKNIAPELKILVTIPHGGLRTHWTKCGKITVMKSGLSPSHTVGLELGEVILKSFFRVTEVTIPPSGLRTLSLLFL